MQQSNRQFPDFLQQPCDDVARQLLGCVLERELDDGVVRVRIVETESYDQDDEASHAYGGLRKRNATMFGKAGHLYVYFTYGMHYCCNIVSGVEGFGSGVLIRAVEPLEGKDIVESRRNITGITALNGPAKLAQALAIDLSFNGHDLHNTPLRLESGTLRPDESIVTSPRVGISKAKDIHRRFFIKDNPYVSKARA